MCLRLIQNARGLFAKLFRAVCACCHLDSFVLNCSTLFYFVLGCVCFLWVVFGSFGFCYVVSLI